MNAYYEDEIAEVSEVDEFDEFDERARRAIRRRFPALPVPRPGNILSAAPSTRPVTRAEFTNATRKLDEKISVNSRAIKTVEGRVNAVADANTRQNKAIATLQSDVKSVREISMLLPLLSSQKTAELADGTEVLVPSDDNFSKLLPLLLLSGGLGGTGGASGGDANSGLGGMMLPLVLILASQK
jgi:hypothetical protein